MLHGIQIRLPLQDPLRPCVWALCFILLGCTSPPAERAPAAAEAPRAGAASGAGAARAGAESRAGEATPAGGAGERAEVDYTTTPQVAWLPPPLENPDAGAEIEAEMKSYTETIPGTDVKFDMVPIPGGRFLMGSPEGEKGHSEDEGPRVEVEVDPFWMGKYEVTWEEYELWGQGVDIFLREGRGAKPTERDKLADAITRPTLPYTDMTFGMGKQGRPAICMTQLAAKLYCKWLSAKTGRYYRLPTEAEWEYACRAGTGTAYSFGDDPAMLAEHAWYYKNSDDKYHPVGRKKPNPWGLYDMHGNVAEWCLDPYTRDGYERFAGKVSRNPFVVPTALYPRVVRGGSWADGPSRLRSAARRGSRPEWKERDPQIPQSIWYHTDAEFVGFRIVRPLKVPTVEEAARYDLDDAQKEAMEEYQIARGFK